MIFETILQPITVGFFLLLSAWSVIKRRPDLLLGLAIASLGFGGLWIAALGTIWTPIKIVGLWSLFYVTVVSRSWVSGLQGPTGNALGFFVVLVFLGCFMGYILPLPAIARDGPGAQGADFRPLVQLIAYLTYLAFVPLAICAFQFRNALNRILSIYAFSALVISLIAVYQFMGFPFIPIYRITGLHNEAAAFVVGGQVVYRVYSLAAEPKLLGIFLTPLLIIGFVLLFQKRSQYPVWWNRKSFFALLLFIDVLTFSTATLLALGLAIGVTSFVFLRGTGRTLSALLFGILVVALMFQSLDRQSSAQPDTGLMSLIYLRTVDRLSDEASDRYEAQALRLITIDNPENLPFGFGLGMYNFRLPNLTFSAGIEPIDSGWIVLLMDLGAVGVATLAYIVLKLVASALRSSNETRGLGAIALRYFASALIVSCLLHFGSGALASIMIWIGMTAALMHSYALQSQRQTLAKASRAGLPRKGRFAYDSIQDFESHSGIRRANIPASEQRRG